MIKKNILEYMVIYTAEPEGGYTVTVPKLPGCVTYGKNMSEAKKMAGDAIKLYIASLEDEKQELPSGDKNVIVGKIDLEIPVINA